MIRSVIFMIALGVPQLAIANSYHHCVSPLVNPVDADALPHPEFSFRLALSENDPPMPFTGQGYAFDGADVKLIGWSGTWAYFEDTLEMVGDFRSETDTVVWRGRGVFADSAVMILNVDRGDDKPLMIRCLPVEGF